LNPDHPGDWLEEALKTRAAMIAPSHFTPEVLRRLAEDESPGTASAFWMESAPHVGLGLAVLGLGLTVDVNRLGHWFDGLLHAPSPALLIAVGLCVSAIWWSTRYDETI
jgi:hypothetical protein